jgi:hypothetical protein
MIIPSEINSHVVKRPIKLGRAADCPIKTAIEEARHNPA